MEVRLSLIGFGNVAQGLVRILIEHGDVLEKNHKLRFLITGITDRSGGNLFDPEGLDPQVLLDAAGTKEGLRSLRDASVEWDAMEMIQSCPADVVVEMSYTNLETGEPATSYIAEALRRRKHVVTTNKGPIALNYDYLSSLAHTYGVQLGVEGTVMSGTPTLRVGRELLSAARIRRIEGILNGTTNYILTQMESGQSYVEALRGAQELGFAEANPAGDVEGFDAAAKVAILSRLVLGEPLELSSIDRTGITQLTVEDMETARANGQHWKLIGSLEKTPNGVKASVKPMALPGEHPLALVRGSTNAILYETELLGGVTIIGPGAGRVQTGYAVVQDLISIYKTPEC